LIADTTASGSWERLAIASDTGLISHAAFTPAAPVFAEERFHLKVAIEVVGGLVPLSHLAPPAPPDAAEVPARPEAKPVLRIPVSEDLRAAGAQRAAESEMQPARKAAKGLEHRASCPCVCCLMRSRDYVHNTD
jgi:hypothetical protein